MIEIPSPDGPVEAFLAGAEQQPGVLFFMDAIGLRPQVFAMCKRIADWGYTVLAPNVFHRDGRAAELAPHGPLDTDEKRAAYFKGAMRRVGHLTPELAERDIPAYVAALREHCAEGPIATTGYCMGARLAVRTASLDESVAACGGFHGGGLVTDDEASPHRRLATARAEFVFGHADKDRSMPASAVAALGEALSDAGLTFSNEIYPDGPHGYTMADTVSYHEPSAERHFNELRALLERTLS